MRNENEKHFPSSSLLCLLQYITETESNLQQVRTLLTSAQRDKVELANQLEEEKRYNPQSAHMWCFVLQTRCFSDS